VQKGTEPGSSQWCLVTGQEATGKNWNTGGFFWTSEKIFFMWGWPCTGTHCPGKSWSLHPWRNSKARHGHGQPALGGLAWAVELD